MTFEQFVEAMGTNTFSIYALKTIYTLNQPQIATLSRWTVLDYFKTFFEEVQGDEIVHRYGEIFNVFELSLLIEAIGTEFIFPLENGKYLIYKE